MNWKGYGRKMLWHNLTSRNFPGGTQTPHERTQYNLRYWRKAEQQHSEYKVRILTAGVHLFSNFHFICARELVTAGLQIYGISKYYKTIVWHRVSYIKI